MLQQNSKELSRDRTESNASTRSKSQSLQRSARELNTKVTKMILTMVIAFTGKHLQNASQALNVGGESSIFVL